MAHSSFNATTPSLKIYYVVIIPFKNERDVVHILEAKKQIKNKFKNEEYLSCAPHRHDIDAKYLPAAFMSFCGVPRYCEKDRRKG